MPYTYEHPRPAVTVDAVLLGVGERDLEVLLIERGAPPFAGSHAFPGGFVDPDEDLPAAMRRELKEETGLQRNDLLEIGAFGTPGRDPRGHTISIAYSAWLSAAEWRRLAPRASDDAAATLRAAVAQPPALAFDHAAILTRALAVQADRIRLGRVPGDRLPEDADAALRERVLESLFGAAPRPRWPR